MHGEYNVKFCLFFISLSRSYYFRNQHPSACWPSSSHPYKLQYSSWLSLARFYSLNKTIQTPHSGHTILLFKPRIEFSAKSRRSTVCQCSQSTSDYHSGIATDSYSRGTFFESQPVTKSTETFLWHQQILGRYHKTFPPSFNISKCQHVDKPNNLALTDLGSGTVKRVELTTLVSWPPVTFGHTFTDQVHGHYSIKWPPVYLESWLQFHVIITLYV
jgi:hypothetical protein